MLSIEQQILERIKRAESVLITFGKTWSGDGIASALALALFLVKQGKKVEVIAEKGGSSETFSFLSGYTDIKNEIVGLRQFVISLSTKKTKVGQVKYKLEPESLDLIVTPKSGIFTKDDITIRAGGFKYDLIFVLDTRDLESLGQVYDQDTELFYKVPVVNIDHHPSNEGFGQINLVELNAVSTTEILFNLFKGFSHETIDEKIATCLLAGMIDKTRSFKTPNVSPNALAIASQLIAMGAAREEIVNRLYRSRSLNTLKLWGLVLARLKGELESKLIWSRVKADDFAETETTETDLNEVIDELIINIPQAKVVALFYETNLQGTLRSHCLLYAMKNLNALQLATEYEPTGTKNLAYFSKAKPLTQFETEVINLLKPKVEKLTT